MNEGKNSIKTITIALFLVAALALAVWSGYRSFVPQGKVTQGGSFGTKAGEVGQDAGGSLAGAPQQQAPSGGEVRGQ